MLLEVGAILEGKVTGITKFGAFVELPEGKTGMVHISEVAQTYVKEIKDHLQDNQVVKVKVLGIDQAGKISLSIKRALEQPRPVFNRNMPPREQKGFAGREPRKPVGEMTFEDKMSKFKQISEEKFSDLKRSNEGKRGGYSRRGSSR